VRRTCDPEGFLEKAGDKLGIVEGRVEGDLQRFNQGSDHFHPSVSEPVLALLAPGN
jgi:hypothetical protein